MKKAITLNLNESLLKTITEKAKYFNISRNALISFVLSNHHIFQDNIAFDKFDETKLMDVINYIRTGK
jgi:hypothetical protein